MAARETACRTLDRETDTDTLSFLQIWANDVYPKLDNFGYNVVGGRVTGPAVGGLTLGGGFSWLTNQYGQYTDPHPYECPQ